MDYYCLLLLWLCMQVSSQSSLQVEGEVICESLLPGGSCEPSSEGRQCVPDARDSCYSKSGGNRNDNVDKVTVRRCYRERAGHYCSRNPGSENPPNILTSINAQVVSFDPDSYFVNVSWTVANVSDHYDGYMLKLYEWKTNDQKPSEPKRCICTLNPSVLNFDFLYLDYYGKDDESMSVEVVPYPSSSTVGDNLAVSTDPEVKPKGCADAFVGNDSVCNVKRYGSARSVTVQSTITCNDTKELHISWEHPSVSGGGPHPPSYYLYIYHEMSLEHTFKVDNVTSVVLGNLNASLEYSAQLQAYGRCSGLGDIHVPSSGLGCGKKSSITNETLLSSNKCDSTTADFVTPNTTWTLADTNATSLEQDLQTSSQSSLLLLLLSIPVTVVFILGMVVMFVLYICRSGEDANEDGDRSPFDYKIFVFYTSANKEEALYIQQHVVHPLSVYFDVIITLDDFTRGDMSKWLEEKVQESNSVLLVTNAHFCSQWSQMEREPVLNSLHHIISASVSSDTLGKFGIVFTKGSHREVSVPNNLYLQLLPLFEMSERTCEVEKICRFVTRSKQFAFAGSPGSTPTTDGPAHVAVHYADGPPVLEDPGHVAAHNADSSPASEDPVHVTVRYADTTDGPTHVIVHSDSSPDSSPTTDGPAHVAVRSVK